MRSGKIVVGKLTFKRKIWDDDSEGWMIDDWNILNALDVEKYEGKKVEIRIIELEGDEAE
jgi:hypothetical protein